jgi:hypothetical protein
VGAYEKPASIREGSFDTDAFGALLRMKLFEKTDI